MPLSSTTTPVIQEHVRHKNAIVSVLHLQALRDSHQRTPGANLDPATSSHLRPVIPAAGSGAAGLGAGGPGLGLYILGEDECDLAPERPKAKFLTKNPQPKLQAFLA